MKKRWGVKGIQAPSPVAGKAAPAGKKSSVNRIGNIPIISKVFVGLRIRGAKKGISKLENKIENMVGKYRQKVDSIVAAAKKTDSARLIDEAKQLQDRLEEAACVEPEFRESVGPDDAGRTPALSKDEKRQIRITCTTTANAAQGVAWKSGTGHGGDPKFPAWKSTFDECFRKEIE